MNDLIATFVEVKLKEEKDFLKIKETLTRIGIASRTTKTLFQSCNILHKQGKYYILHFKELFALDGKETDFSEDDKARRNTIAILLRDWGLLDLVTPEDKLQPRASMNHIKVIPFREKSEWTLQSKYNIGVKKK